jgi:hypothetical protein
MSDLFSREPPPKWHMLVLGCVAAGGVAALGLYFHERAMIYFAVFCGVFVAGFGLLLIRARSTAVSIPVQARPTTYSIVQYARLIVIVLLLASIVLSYLHKR